jgi:hypothetical protein
MKHFLAALAFGALVACGGDSSTAPKNPTFPSVAGVYAISGSFTGAALPFSGTITFSQPSREQPTLEGSANLTVYATDGNITFGTIDNASVSETGLVGFNVGSAVGTATWRFTGTLTGTTITGTHLLSDATSSAGGTFSAVRQ